MESKAGRLTKNVYLVGAGNDKVINAYNQVTILDTFPKDLYDDGMVSQKIIKLLQ